MNNVEFEEESISRQHSSKSEEGVIIKFLQKRGFSKESAKKTLLAVAIIAFLVSALFWFQVL